jgi:hypothetical protein
MHAVEFFTFSWFSWPGLPPLLDAIFNWSSSSFWVALISSLAGAHFLSNKTAETGAFNFPVNFIALFLCASLSNWLARDMPLPLDPAVQLPAVLSMIGMTFAGVTIIWIVKRG